MRLIVRWREPCLCLLGEPVCLPGQPCYLQLQQPARWDSNSWGDGGWGNSWFCGFTSGGGLARDSLSNGTCHKQSTHLSGRRHHCYHIGLDLQVICVAVHVIGGACDGYGSWHNVEHRKQSCACCVEDTHPLSTEGLEMISDCTTDLHLQRVLLSDSPRPRPRSTLATGLLHALLDLSRWA